MDLLSSRIVLRPSDLDYSRRFYLDLLGLAVYREFGSPDDPRLVFLLGQGLLELSGHAGHAVMIWMKVRDVHVEHARLAAAGVPIVREPIAEPWGLTEMQLEDPDGIRISTFLSGLRSRRHRRCSAPYWPRSCRTQSTN